MLTVMSMTKLLLRQILTPALTPVSMPLPPLRQMSTSIAIAMPLSIQQPMPPQSTPSSSPAAVSASPVPARASPPQHP